MTDQAQQPSQKAGVDAVVEPIKAVGAAAGFAIGFLASHRTGADNVDAAMHGLLGAVIFYVIAWYVGLQLVRQMMAAHVEEQRRIYTARVEEMNRRVREGQMPGYAPMPVPQGRASLKPPE